MIKQEGSLVDLDPRYSLVVRDDYVLKAGRKTRKFSTSPNQRTLISLITEAEHLEEIFADKLTSNIFNKLLFIIQEHPNLTKADPTLLARIENLEKKLLELTEKEQLEK
jgi:hypothetical protein